MCFGTKKYRYELNLKKLGVNNVNLLQVRIFSDVLLFLKIKPLKKCFHTFL